MPKVFNKRGDYPTNAVYVGRPTKWGNPFLLMDEDDRGLVLARFEKYLDENPDLKKAAIEELRGRDLVCWCSPKKCHADVLLQIANGPEIKCFK